MCPPGDDDLSTCTGDDGSITAAGYLWYWAPSFGPVDISGYEGYLNNGYASTPNIQTGGPGYAYDGSILSQIMADPNLRSNWTRTFTQADGFVTDVTIMTAESGLFVTGGSVGLIGVRGFQLLNLWTIGNALQPSGPPNLPPFEEGGKTRGVLRTSAGDFPLESGWDGPAGANVPKGARGFDIVTRTHVEGHAAALMRQQGVSQGTLYINNPKVCSPCNRLLPRMLPPGAQLTVVPAGEESILFIGIE
jgi:hypothetical protein